MNSLIKKPSWHCQAFLSLVAICTALLVVGCHDQPAGPRAAQSAGYITITWYHDTGVETFAVSNYDIHQGFVSFRNPNTGKTTYISGSIKIVDNR